MVLCMFHHKGPRVQRANSATPPIELEIPDDAQVKDISLRISGTATLDGYCTIDNMDPSDSDRSLQFQTDRCSKEIVAALGDMVQQGSTVCLAVGAEFLSGYLSHYLETGSTITVTFLVELKLSDEVQGKLDGIGRKKGWPLLNLSGHPFFHLCRNRA